jgi:hypothetical protein
MLKAIETFYNGYRFRSRLEARWAVFFDSLGIEYQYESEGYDLGKDGFYLPDFYLPGYDLFVEVKPSRTLFENERNKACSLAKQSGKRLLILFDCVPEKDVLLIEEDIVEKVYCPSNVTLLACCSCGCLGFHNHDYSFVFEFKEHCGGRLNNTWKMLHSAQLEKSADGKHIYNIPNSFLLKAYRAAQQARFEHGETPLVRR